MVWCDFFFNINIVGGTAIDSRTIRESLSGTPAFHIFSNLIGPKKRLAWENVSSHFCLYFFQREWFFTFRIIFYRETAVRVLTKYHCEKCYHSQWDSLIFSRLLYLNRGRVFLNFLGYFPVDDGSSFIEMQTGCSFATVNRRSHRVTLLFHIFRVSWSHPIVYDDIPLMFLRSIILCALLFTAVQFICFGLS